MPYNAPYYGMAAAQFDHHVNSSHDNVHCKARGFAYKQYPPSCY